MKASLLFLLMIVSVMLPAQQPLNLARFKRLDINVREGGPRNESFDGGLPPDMWLPQGFSYDSTGGENGTGALVYDKNNSENYSIATLPLSLKPECTYRVSVKYRAEHVQHAYKSTSRIFCVQFSWKGKFACGSYHYETIKEKEWTEIVLTFQPPVKFDQAHAGFFLTKNATGKIWWDNLTVEPIGTIPATIYGITPPNLTITSDHDLITLKSSIFSPQFESPHLAAHVTALGKSYLWKGEDHRYCGKLKGLPEGKLKLHVNLIDLKAKTILAEKSFTLFVKRNVRRNQGTYIDEYQRTIVDGKPFMPLGFYCSKVDESLLQRLQQGGFNCIMPYHGGGKTLLERFDLAQNYEIKLLMNVMYQRPQGMAQAYPVTEFEGTKGIEPVLQAWADKLKGHPALLGYYLADENPIEEVPYMRKVRELINERDPNHLTVTLTYISRHFPFFADTGDVLAVDNYPIENDTSKSIASIAQLVTAAKGTGLPIWLVPQAFNWGAYKAKTPEEYAKFRFPTEQEMRSMYLTGAVYGAKGFLLYNYSDVFSKAEKHDGLSTRNHWNDILAAVKPLQQLEPFILSIEPPPAIRITQSINAHLKPWSANGKNAIAIVGLGPGKCSLEFTVDSPRKLKSRYGKTQLLDGGNYVFQGDGISSDVLFEE